MTQNFGIYTGLYNSTINGFKSGKIQSTKRFLLKQIAETQMSIKNLTFEISLSQNAEIKSELESKLQLARDKFHVLDLLFAEYDKISYDSNEQPF